MQGQRLAMPGLIEFRYPGMATCVQIFRYRQLLPRKLSILHATFEMALPTLAGNAHHISITRFLANPFLATRAQKTIQYAYFRQLQIRTRR
jgi:hypothetical protein